MRYHQPQIEDAGDMAYTERIELAEIRNPGNVLTLQDADGRIFDFTRRLFIAKSRYDGKFATYYHIDENGSFVRAENLREKDPEKWLRF